MILSSLVSQLEQRFQHEKRANVCLWFDERQEFGRLLPALQVHLAGMKTAPFVLLSYDATQKQGQIWLKRQAHELLAAAPPAARRLPRFVLYLPLSEDRLDTPDPNDGTRLDFLEEYRISGLLWRVGGKRPTLFSFLRQAGVRLPENPADQRRLFDGGQDSLLAKYVAKFVDRSPAFWETTVTPELAKSRLIGDVDQAILDLAADPEVAWQELCQRGLGGEFLDCVRVRFGFQFAIQPPEEWVQELVGLLALTETFLGYGEPADFPFINRLPPVTLRPHHIQLLQRWLRDTEHRAAWDRWVQLVESRIDLSAWAKGRIGLAFGFPHLVELRWQEIRASFEHAAGKASATSEFFERYSATIAKEAEFARASAQAAGVWELMRDLGALVQACQEGERRVKEADTPMAHAALYVELAGSVDKGHLGVRQRAEEFGLPAAARVADRGYANYTNALNEAFLQHAAAAGSISLPGLRHVTARLDETLWHAKGRRAVVIVDALRYDCALAIKDELRGQQVEVEPVLGTLPTVTPIGMTALLPLAGRSVSLEIKGNSLHPRVDGKDTSVRANRLDLLAEFGADCREITDVEGSSEPPADLGELLVVFGHEEVDHIGHGQAEALIRHVDLEIRRLARLIRKLHRWGYEDVHVVTDHGFIMLDESQLPSEVPCDRAWCHVLKERFALVPAEADIPLVRFPFAWDSTIRVAVPPGLAFFKAEKSFSHGGAALQELVIPHLVSRGQATQAKRIGVEVVLPTFELMRTVVKVTLRPKALARSPNQMELFAALGRTLALDVLRTKPDARESVLASKAKEVRLEAKDDEQSVTLFLHSAASFAKGELLELDIRDVETMEQFPPGGIKLTVGRDM